LDTEQPLHGREVDELGPEEPPPDAIEANALQPQLYSI
jgi:hypothetical protein